MDVSVGRIARLDCGRPSGPRITSLQRLRDLVAATADMPATSEVRLLDHGGHPQLVRYIDVIGDQA